MSDLSTSYCYPVCAACGVAGSCHRVGEIKAPPRHRTPWSPNRLNPERLECGHTEIPWPIVKHFGRNIQEVYCGECKRWVEYKESMGESKPKKGKRKEVTGQEVIPF